MSLCSLLLSAHCASVIGEMEQRRFGRETQRNHIRDDERFAALLGRPPDTATAEAVRHFQVEQLDQWKCYSDWVT
jgi:hypothetical protein